MFSQPINIFIFFSVFVLREIEKREFGEKYHISLVWRIREIKKKDLKRWVPPPFPFLFSYAKKGTGGTYFAHVSTFTLFCCSIILQCFFLYIKKYYNVFFYVYKILQFLSIAHFPLLFFDSKYSIVL
jgi:hypothetical protein